MPQSPREDRGRPFDLLPELLSAVDGSDPARALVSAGIARGGPWERLLVRPTREAAPLAQNEARRLKSAAAEADAFFDADAATASGARDAASVQRRLEWYLGCHQLARTRTSLRFVGSGQSRGADPQYFGIGAVNDFAGKAPVEPAAKASGPGDFQRGYYALKMLAFRLGSGLAPLWAGVPQATTSFHAGPWIEDYFWKTFARPARRTVLAVKLRFELELLNGPEERGKGANAGGDGDGDGGHQRPSLLWSRTQEGGEAQGESIVVLSRKAATGAFLSEDLLTGGAASERVRLLLLEAHRLGLQRPVAELEAARAAGAATAEVLYAFDYDLFYPFVPVFAPWERLSMAFVRVQDEHDLLSQTNDPALLLRAAAAHGNLALLRDVIRVLVMPNRAAYLTVAQRAQGVLLPHLTKQDVRNPEPPDEMLVRLCAKTLVINSGGGGDVPIPLLAHEWSPDEFSLRVSFQTGAGAGADAGAVGAGAPPPPLLLSFVGRVYPGSVRQEVVETAARALGGKFLAFFEGDGGAKQGSAFVAAPMPDAVRAFLAQNAALPPAPPPPPPPPPPPLFEEDLGATTTWLGVMSRSSFQLAPSGTNPSSFRLYEVLQMGQIPIFLFDDK